MTIIKAKNASAFNLSSHKIVLKFSAVLIFFILKVSDRDAPGYSQVIKNKMAFSMMRARLSARQYGSLDEFHADVELIVRNCCTFNMMESIFAKVVCNNLLFNKFILGQFYHQYFGSSIYLKIILSSIEKCILYIIGGGKIDEKLEIASRIDKEEGGV